ncbi:FMN-binding protein [Ruminococcus sp. AF41-9]|nr:FMN-binding protein [Ruminococcus sp. AF41-9]
MNNQNFYLRLVALLLIIMSVFFYNGTVKDKEQEQNIADLTAKVESLEEQQDQILTAIQETYEEQKAAAENKAASDTSDADSQEKSGDSKEDADQADSEAEGTEESGETYSDDSDNFYKNGTYEGSGTGYGGTITVQVTMEDDTITAVSVVSAPGEDSAYLSQGENVISSILSEQSTDVDTISGATFSSTGILEAVNDALSKAENE